MSVPSAATPWTMPLRPEAWPVIILFAIGIRECPGPVRAAFDLFCELLLDFRC
jgi:hypothetical protein